MNISQNGIKLIQSFEGCVLHAYRDVVNVLTIGWGHTGNVKEGQTLTQAQADFLLLSDLKSYVDGVNGCVKVKLNQNQFDALVSFAYNLGVGALKTSTLLSLLNKGDFVGASNEFPKWCHAGGKVVQGLVNRRNKERELFLKPVTLIIDAEKLPPKRDTLVRVAKILDVAPNQVAEYRKQGFYVLEGNK